MVVPMKKLMEDVYADLIDRMTASSIIKLMDINKSYGISIDEM